MKKFTVQTIKSGVSIVEVELEILSGICEPGFQPIEWKARIIKPDTFHMKRERTVDGKREVFYEPDIWCWHAFYDTKEDARVAATKLVEQQFAFNLRKYSTTYTDTDVTAAITTIMFVPLTA